MAADANGRIAAVVLAFMAAAASCRGQPNDPPSTHTRSEASIETARALCQAVQTVPRERRATCCDAPADAYGMLYERCVDLLSTSIRDGAVVLRPPEVEACGQAVAQTLAGCEWVRPVLPPPPAACVGVVHGQLGEGQSCRSSLECSAGLHCDGVHPRTPGTCRAPKPQGETCERSIDPLQGLLGHGVDPDHPVCASGPCVSHRCLGAVEVGGACETSRACGRGNRCAAGRCANGKASLGQPCSDHDACVAGVCIAQTCVAQLDAEASCTTSAQCRGACLRQDDGTAICGPRCSAAIPAVQPHALQLGIAPVEMNGRRGLPKD